MKYLVLLIPIFLVGCDCGPEYRCSESTQADRAEFVLKCNEESNMMHCQHAAKEIYCKEIKK